MRGNPNFILIHLVSWNNLPVSHRQVSQHLLILRGPNITKFSGSDFIKHFDFEIIRKVMREVGAVHQTFCHFQSCSINSTQPFANTICKFTIKVFKTCTGSVFQLCNNKYLLKKKETMNITLPKRRSFKVVITKIIKLPLRKFGC